MNSLGEVLIEPRDTPLEPEEDPPQIVQLQGTDEEVHLGGIKRTFANTLISIIGAGVLGLPYTFRVSGWGVGSLSVCACGAVCYYSMLLLVRCRQRLRHMGHRSIVSYGDLGQHVYGRTGQHIVETFVLLSQGGCCISYLLFIGQNLASFEVLSWTNKTNLIWMLAPVQILLSWVRSLAKLAPFSIFADFSNLLAMAVVIKDDLGSFKDFSEVRAFTNLSSIPFALGVACYCFEGFSMTLPLEASMKEPEKFPKTLGFSMVCITILYVSFGSIGYFAFGDLTNEIITINLQNDWTTMVVKLGLCFGLFFTFPVMLHPVHEIVECWFRETKLFKEKVPTDMFTRDTIYKGIRMVIILFVATLAIRVPGFATFCGLLGATVCAMLAFVLPGLFHINVFWNDIGRISFIIDLFLIFFGLLFACYGTFYSIRALIDGSSSPLGSTLFKVGSNTM